MPGYIGEPDIPRAAVSKGYATFGVITRGKPALSQLKLLTSRC